MPTREQHEQQARDNVSLCRLLEDAGQHLDWAITALFYAALHYVDAYLLPDAASNHVKRVRLIQQRPELDQVFEDYRKLQDLSRDTRYECLDPTPAEVEHYRQHIFGRLEAHLLALLKAREGS